LTGSGVRALGAWRSISTAVVFILLGVAALSQEPTPGGLTQQEQPQTAKPNDPGGTQPQGTAQQAIIIYVQPPQKTEAEAEEDRQERHEKSQLDRRLVELTGELSEYTGGLYRATVALAVATIVLVIATVGLVIFAFIQSGDMKASIAAATEANSISRDSLHAAQRPWISEESSPASGLTWKDDGCSVTIHTIIKNVGITPAQGVDIDIHIYSMTQKRLPNDEMSKKIECTKEGGGGFGTMLFPNIVFKQNTTATLSRTQIKEFQDQFPSSPGRNYVMAQVMVCVQYMSTLDRKPARTIRIYDLKCTGSVEDHRAALAIQVDENTPLDRLVMTNFWLPNFAD
jgi:hypothetical protein